MDDLHRKVAMKVAMESAATLDRINSKDLREKLGVDEKWIKARLADKGCGFPEPMKENGRLYWSKKEIDCWILAQVLKLYPLVRPYGRELAPSPEQR